MLQNLMGLSLLFDRKCSRTRSSTELGPIWTFFLAVKKLIWTDVPGQEFTM